MTSPSLYTLAGRKNNWPPLPEKFPVGPCFYHDIAVDIPIEFQKTVKIMYNLWMCKRTARTPQIHHCRHRKDIKRSFH